MFLIPAMTVLLVFMVGRPFDLSEALRGLPLLNLFCGLAVVGYAIDLKLRLSEFRPPPQLGWVLSFMIWCWITVVVRAPETLNTALMQLGIPLVIYLLLAFGVRTFKGLEVLLTVVFVCATWIALVTTHMGFQQPECVNYPPGESQLGIATGRSCQLTMECRIADTAKDARCEKVGWFGISTIGHRIRYVGILQDPNEVAMLVSVMLPIAFAFYQRKRTRSRLFLLLGPMVLFFMSVRFSSSRGGLLVMMTVLGLYAVQRFGLKRTVLLALPLMVPLALLATGGSERGDGEESTYKRLGCMLAGANMLLEWPVFGAGYGRFGQHHGQTAHNSYLLAAGELGVVGMLLWAGILYYSAKIPLLAARRYKSEEAEVARIWGRALGTSMIGLAVGNFFLSFTYHNVMWLFFGLCSAFSAAVKTHDRSWNVRVGWREWLLIALACAALVTGVLVYTAAEL